MARLAVPLIIFSLASCSYTSSTPTTIPVDASAIDQSIKAHYDDLKKPHFDDRDAQEIAAQALKDNNIRQSDIKAFQIALWAYGNDHGSLPQPTRDGELSTDSSENRNGLVGKYLTNAGSAPNPGEWYCYGYSANGEHGFVAAWLDIEDVPIVASINPETLLSDADAKALLQGATRDNFNSTGSCPAISGYTMVRIQSVR
jgi:hypothetical protein